MIREKVVGSKVYEIVNEAMVKIPFEVVRIIGWGEVDDFCEHYIIKDASGKEKEVRECDVVFIPNDSAEETSKVYQYLIDNDCGYNEVYLTAGGYLAVAIEWGDWKHSHLWCDDLMKYLGYVPVCQAVVTDENGSDCYSATHFYKKK